jgi:multiple sugar transport system ATP-binding protein
MTGNETIVTCAIGESQMVVKMEKDFEIALDAPVGIKIDAGKVCLFDAASGERLRAAG